MPMASIALTWNSTRLAETVVHGRRMPARFAKGHAPIPLQISGQEVSATPTARATYELVEAAARGSHLGEPGTMAFGFRADLTQSLFGWSQEGGACQECHVNSWLRAHPRARVCQLPRLAVKPITEGSTGASRDHLR